MAIHQDVQHDAPADALGAVAAQHITTRLNRAVQIAESDLPARLGEFRELIAELADQADAWELTRSTDQPGDNAQSRGAEREGEAPAEPGSAGASPSRSPAHYADSHRHRGETDQPASRLECTALARVGGEPVGEFLLIPFGEVMVERPVSGGSFVFTPEHATSVKSWFDAMGRKLAIDYEHQSFDRLNTRPDGLRPAAGWIGGIEVRDDGLWAVDVSWTDRATQLLNSGEYRYFSPVIYWADEDRTKVAGLGPVALTNDPAMRGVRPLTAARREANVGPAAVESVDEETDERIVAALSEVDVSCLRSELEVAQEEVELLRRQVQMQNADAFVERGMRLGKIVDSTSMDWRDDYLRDAEQTEARLQRSPVILPPGRVVRLSAGGAVAERRGELSRGAERYRQHGVDVEDLEAYERAAAAGRVMRYGG